MSCKDKLTPEFRGGKLPNQTQLITADGNNLDVLVCLFISIQVLTILSLILVLICYLAMVISFIRKVNVLAVVFLVT